MYKKFTLLFVLMLSTLSVLQFVSCSKSAPTPTPAPVPVPIPPVVDPCAGKTITLSAATTAASCISDGTITITATGSTGFTYKLNAGGSYQASNSFSNLAAATYTVFAKDGDGCEKSTTATVASAAPLTISATFTQPTNCLSNGSITVTAGGAPGFTYKLNAGGPYQASNVFNNIAAGSYIVFAKSTAGCETSTNVTVTSNNTIVVSATTNASSLCSTSGIITIAASGSTGFTYKLNAAGTYQASNIFSGLAPGSYTAFAKDVAGCENSTSVTVGNNTTPGPLFSSVKNLLTNRCVSCHNNGLANGGANFQVDCNIVSLQDRIRVRAVVEGTMPQGGPVLTASEKATITNWINGGGKLTD